jgi:hypothetical protein
LVCRHEFSRAWHTGQGHGLASGPPKIPADLAVAIKKLVYESEVYSGHMNSIPFISVIGWRFCLFLSNDNDFALLDFYPLDFDSSRARRTQCARHILLPKSDGTSAHVDRPFLDFCGLNP